MQSQLRLLIDDELIVDLFAGGGGMSTAIEAALGRSPDISINHNEEALSMHRANHPQSRHFIADVFEVCPRGATQGQPVGLLHLSPDCTHHSQAAGGQPRSSRIRALSWVAKRWAGQVSPRVITLENVAQIKKWGPLVAKRCKHTGRVLKRAPETRDGWAVAEPGERVPVQDQFLVPDPKRAGQTWRRFIADLEALGYQVEYRNLVASDYGAGTKRDRLFMVARRDGGAIAWPEPTHAKNPKKGQKKESAAADHIDWSIPVPSIFDRAHPLADATHRRIARGIVKFVLESGDPFIVPVTHQGADRVHDIREPLRTITGANRGEFAFCAPTLIQAAHGEGQPGRAQRWGTGAHDIRDPMGTITASGGGGYGIAAATLVQTGYGEREGQDPRSLDIRAPLGTVVAGGCKHALVTAFMAQANDGFNTVVGKDLREPLTTITNSGSQQQLVTADLAALSPEHEAGALRVAAFLMRYYGEGGQWGDVREPMATITTKDRLALVTVLIRGTPFVIVDIGLRMLTPRELYSAQGFPASYIIHRGHDGRVFSKQAQVRMCGNSVSPKPATALIRALVPELAVRRIAA